MYKNVEESNKQQQTCFVLYMIVGSYFHKSTCTNKVLEKQLYLYYREMPFRQQCGLEERVIEDTEKDLREILPALAELNCTVSIRRRGGEYHLQFNTGFEGVVVTVDGNEDYRIRTVEGARSSHPQFA